jgi:hypothetical protein
MPKRKATATMVLGTSMRVAGVAALGVVAAITAVVGTTPAGAEGAEGAAAAAAVVKSTFRRLRPLRRRAVAAAVEATTAGAMAAVVTVAAVMMAGSLWTKSSLPWNFKAHGLAHLRRCPIGEAQVAGRGDESARPERLRLAGSIRARR